MTGRKPYAEQCTRVYTRTGTRAHLMSPVQTIRNGSVLCPVLPEWFTEWHGTGSQDEIDRAASLPLCKRCEDQAHREDEYYSEPPQFTPQELAAVDLAPVGPAAGGSAAPDADPAGTLQPGRVPAKTSSPVPAPQLPGAGLDPSSPPPAVRSAAGTPGPDTAGSPPGIGQPAVRARAETPAGAVADGAPAVPDRSTSWERTRDAIRAQVAEECELEPPRGLRGQEARDAIRKAQSGHSHRQRAGRVRGAARQPGPGMVRKLPPETRGGTA